jgi:hypothetical protein
MNKFYAYIKHYAFGSLVILLMSLATLAAVEQDKINKTDCTATIERSVEDNLEVFQAFLKNQSKQAIEGRYTFEAIRIGEHGKSVSRQKGEFNAAPEEELLLSKTSVNIDDSDAYNIVLKIFSDEDLLCADSISTLRNQ